MNKIRMFELSIKGDLIRFYLMMAVVIILGFLGQFTLAAILGVALAVSFILGISFTRTTKKTIEEGNFERIDKTVKRAA